MGCILPGSSVQWMSQAKILKWVTIAFSGDLSDAGIKPVSSALQVDSLPVSHQGSSIYYISRHYIIMCLLSVLFTMIKVETSQLLGSQNLNNYFSNINKYWLSE